MVTIVLLTQGGRLTRLLRCFENSCEVHRKFSRVISPKVSLKRTLFVRIFQPDFEFHFFKNSTFFTLPNMRFGWCVIWSRFFLLKQKARLTVSFRYLEHARKGHKIFSRSLWKKIQSEKWGFGIKFLPDFELRFFKISTFFKSF